MWSGGGFAVGRTKGLGMNAPHDGNGRPASFAPLLLAIVWILVFAAGIVVETARSRFYLAPMATLDEHLRSNDTTSLSLLSVAITGTLPALISGSEAVQGADPPLDVSTLRKNLFAVAEKRSEREKLSDYFICVMCYSPINIAILALIAGAMGGSMSNLYAKSLTTEERAQLAESNPVSLHAIMQSPWVAAVEGLIAYVCIVAGLYVLVDDPFKNATPALYAKLAGLVSAIAFAVGYDHSRFGGLLNAIPIPRSAPTQGGDKPAADAPRVL